MKENFGRCVRFGPNGYGFIAETETGKEYFVHIRDTVARAALFPGDRVAFEPHQGPKGPQAKNVRVVRDGK